MRIYAGIDPGLGGGLALVAPSGGLIDAVKMPSTEKDVLDLLTSWRVTYSPSTIHAALEFVRSSPQMGVASAFKFGCGYGGLRMALLAAEIPFEEVTPPKWQKALGCRTRGDKNVSKRKAQELWPGHTVTHAVADAMLLAEYCRRTTIGTVTARELSPAQLPF